MNRLTIWQGSSGLRCAGHKAIKFSNLVIKLQHNKALLFFPHLGQTNSSPNLLTHFRSFLFVMMDHTIGTLVLASKNFHR